MITQVLILVSLSFAPEVSGYVPGRAVPTLRQAPTDAELTARMRQAVSKRDTAEKIKALPAGCKRRALLQGSGYVTECF